MPASMMGFPQLTPKSVYIAGPMTGRLHYNVDAFNYAAMAWREAGWKARIPFEANTQVWQWYHGRDFDPRNDKCDWGDPIMADVMLEDMRLLIGADAIALLRDWQQSKGTKAELMIAINMGKTVYDAETFKVLELTPYVDFVPVGETALEEANRLVHGPRQASYGHPIDDYTRTGRIWGAILGIPDIDPRICCLMMAGVKMSREVNAPKRDNRVDGAGYFECANMVHERQLELLAAD